MSWPFIIVILLILAIASMWILGGFVKNASETVYVLMWNDGVVGVTSDRAVAEQFVGNNSSPNEGHYVRWLPFTVDATPQTYPNKKNNWGRPSPKARSTPL